MRKLILASSSPRRRELLKSVGLDFQVIPSNIDEKMNPRLGPQSQAEDLSLQKAKAVVKKAPKDSVIIAADTIVVLGKEMLGKPETNEAAKKMLKKLQGSMHIVVTGFTVLDTTSNKTITDSDMTKIWMRKLTTKEIDAYIKRGHVLDKAGGYAMQGIGALLFERIEGDYFNVVGLPLSRLALSLKKFGFLLL